MSRCDKSDATLLSSRSNTAAVDDMSKGIKKVTLEDDNNTQPCDIGSSREEEDTISEKKCTSCEQKLEHTKTDEICRNSASSDADTTDIVSGDIVTSTEVSICANCGKEGASNTCNKCKQVKYCNAVCKKKHKTKHKKACNRRVAELRDIELFKQPPPLHGDCPICFLRMPTLDSGRKFQSCCGKTICSGCIHTVLKRDRGVSLCPFCRLLTPATDKEIIKRIMKRVEVDDARAINQLGSGYCLGEKGLSRDYAKAVELWHRAAELGHVAAYHSICFQRLPLLDTGKRYKPCCGKVICSGCIHAPVYDDQGNAVDNKICPFCRTPTPRLDKEIIKRLYKRMEVGDAEALRNLGYCYKMGRTA